MSNFRRIAKRINSVSIAGFGFGWKVSEEGNRDEADHPSPQEGSPGFEVDPREAFPEWLLKQGYVPESFPNGYQWRDASGRGWRSFVTSNPHAPRSHAEFLRVLDLAIPPGWEGEVSVALVLVGEPQFGGWRHVVAARGVHVVWPGCFDQLLLEHDATQTSS